MKYTLFFIFSIIFLLNCSSIGDFLSGPGLPGPDRKSPAESAGFYYKLLMWKDYDRAAALVDHEKARQYENFVLKNKDALNITEYFIKEVILSEDGKEGVVKVLVKYFKLPSVAEKTITVEDTWILEGKNWYISSDFDENLF